jgi:hypothetical protein
VASLATLTSQPQQALPESCQDLVGALCTKSTTPGLRALCCTHHPPQAIKQQGNLPASAGIATPPIAKSSLCTDLLLLPPGPCPTTTRSTASAAPGKLSLPPPLPPAPVTEPSMAATAAAASGVAARRPLRPAAGSVSGRWRGSGSTPVWPADLVCEGEWGVEREEWRERGREGGVSCAQGCEL